MKKIVPLGDRVLLRLSESPKQIGRILLPENARKKPQSGEVLAVGPDCKREDAVSDTRPIPPQRIKVGMVCFFNVYAGCTLPDQDDMLLIREDELIGCESP